VDAPEGLIEVFLARFTSIDPPFDWAEQHGARFIDLTQARGLRDVELQILRRAQTIVTRILRVPALPKGHASGRSTSPALTGLFSM
jgi:hypothetical protein